MTNNDINDIIDALNDGIDLCVLCEKAETFKKRAISVEDGLRNSKNALYDLLNGK